jgi:hypothetical protein
LDEGIQPRHLRIFRRGTQWLCQPMEDAEFAASRPRADDGTVALDSGIKVRAAGVRIVFSLIGAPWEHTPRAALDSVDTREPTPEPVPVAEPRGKSRRRRLALILGGVLLCSVTLAAWLAFGSPLNDAKTAVPAMAASKPPVMAPRPMLHSAETLRHDAVAALKAWQLDSLVQVSSRPGFLRLEGELTTPEITRFEQALQELQDRFGSTTRIEASIKSLVYALPFQIRQVLLGIDSRIILNDGTAIYEGQHVAGFRLAAVRAGKLLFTGKRTVEVAW